MYIGPLHFGLHEYVFELELRKSTETSEYRMYELYFQNRVLQIVNTIIALFTLIYK